MKKFKILPDPYDGPAKVILGSVAAYGLYRYIKKQADKGKIQSQVNTYSNYTVPVGPGTSINVREIARQIGQDLGVSYSWYNPQSWTENDNKVRDLLLTVPKSLIPALKVEYFNQYERDLQADLQRHLDDYNRVSYLFNDGMSARGAELSVFRKRKAIARPKGRPHIRVVRI